MRITIDYSETKTEQEQLAVDSAEYLSDYSIRIKFSDGNEKIVDFQPFLSKSLHPSIQKYLDKNEFSKFTILAGNLNWNDYELIFPVTDLYNGFATKQSSY